VPGRDGVEVTVFERLWVWRVRAACEMALALCGGDDLVDDARTEASWYADLLHPWDGRGCEPDARVHAWLSILLARRTVAAGPLER
jgi:hypothetical protein